MTVSTKVLSRSDIFKQLEEIPVHPARQNYLAMFSSWFGGITREVPLMLVPIDDHVVHRGDGIFEAIKCLDGRIYTLERHLARLERSARFVQMALPYSRTEIIDIIKETIRVGGSRDCLIRLYVTRGPGGFTTNPYECLSTQMYVVITTLKALAEEKFRSGVIMATSQIPVKEGAFATVKSCNYLANVLMRKEAVDAGVDFTVSVDPDGHLAESSTENFAIVTTERELLVPSFTRTLHGITISRVLELAQPLLHTGELKKIAESRFTLEQAYAASEAMFIGTTLDVISAVKFDGHTIGTGRPGPLARHFRELLLQDQKGGSEVIEVSF